MWSTDRSGTAMSASAGSGQTLLRSWIGEAGLEERAGWVPVQGEERDPQQLWPSVPGALRARLRGRSWSGP